MTTDRHNLKRRILKLLGHGVALISVCFVLVTMYRQMGELRSITINSYSLLWLFLAVTLCMGSIVVSALVWHILLKGAGAPISFPMSFSIIGSSQLGKYLPGNLMHYAGRFVLGKKAGISVELMTVTVGAETILALASVFLLVPIGMVFDPASSGQLHTISPFMKLIHIHYGLVSLILLLGFVIIVCYRNQLVSCLSMLNMRYILVAFGLSLWNYLLFSSILLTILSGLHIVHTELFWSRLVWGFCLAWLAGFIVPGVPGGIGIREAVMIGVFGPVLGAGNAATSAAVLRLVTTAGDLAISAIAYWIGRRALLRAGAL